MRRISTFILILIFFQLFLGNAAFACDMNLSPENFEVKSGDTVNFTLERYATHGRCVLPLEDTQIKVQGGEVTNISSWIEGNPDVLEFQVQFSESGAAEVKVERDCSKGLQTVDAQGYVKEISDTGSTIESFNENNENVLGSGGKKTVEDKAINKKKMSGQFLKKIHTYYWYFFILGGLLLYLLRLTKLRKIWLFISVVVLGFYFGGCPCPIGQVFGVFLGKFTLLLALPIIIAMIWGRVFCGWVCPLGGVQEFINIKKLSVRVPDKLDSILKVLKYLILFLFGMLTIVYGKNIWGQYEPFKVLFNFSGTNLTVAILFVTLIASVFIERFFCRYICPLGAILAFISRFAPFRIRLDETKCCSCKACTTGICPTHAIKANKDEKYPVIDSKECIRCRKCIEVCKRNGIS